MKSLEERKDSRAKRRLLAEREASPAAKIIQPQDQLGYVDLKVPELRKLLADRGQDVPGKAKRDELVQMLEDLDSEAASEQPEHPVPGGSETEQPQTPVIPPAPWGNQ